MITANEFDCVIEFVATRTTREFEAYLRGLIAALKDGKALSEFDGMLLTTLDFFAVQAREQPDFFSAHSSEFANYLNGLKSPDKEQQRRFQALESVLRDVTPAKANVVLLALEKGKRKGGRRVGTKINDDAVLKKMRDATTVEGLSVYAAARKFALEAKSASTLESTAKRLERKYRKYR